MTGGGSGGHITPLLAVAHELKKQRKDVQVVYIGQQGDNFSDLPGQHQAIDAIHLVRAGKLRRYHGEGLKQLLDVKTVVKNVRDGVWVLIGLWQSVRLLRKLKPDVVFVKGGFVGVPVGLSAAFLRIPYVTHDSDALPGLANRIVAPWARMHTVALPKEAYRYPADKIITVGVPLAHHYKPLTNEDIRSARRRIGVPQHGKVLLVTGGGLGAQRLNQAVAVCLPGLLDRYPDLTVLQLAGWAHEVSVRQRYKKELSDRQQKRVIVKGYVSDSYLYSSAADVIVTRAGATSIAEFAAQQKACIVVPNPLLTDGHQLKNAQVLTDDKAVKLVREDVLRQDDHALMPPIVDLFDHPSLITELGRKLGKFSHHDAAKQLAVVLLKVADAK